MELRRAGLPYIVLGGMSFYDRKEVRDMLAYLKLLVSPADEVALLRIINRPARGIGQATVTALVEQAVKVGKPLWELFKPEHAPSRGACQCRGERGDPQVSIARSSAINSGPARAAGGCRRDLIRDIGYQRGNRSGL